MSEPDLDLDLEAIRRRVELSTAGPWDRHGADVWAGGALLFRGRDGQAEIRHQADADAEFVAHARDDVLTLLDALQQVKEGD